MDKEIEHTENYLYIQELRYDNRFRYSIEVEPTLVDVLVPPLVIQTFAENTIKYAISPGESIFLTIDITEDEDPGYFNIRIEDSGNRFSQAVLLQLNQHKRIVDERGEHFGIYNVIKRFALLYGERFRIEFSNGDEGSGARIRMRLPKTTNQEE